MRKKLIDLFNKAVVFEYSLPTDTQNKSSVTVGEDHVFRNPAKTDLSELIYNSIVDLAFEDYNIETTKLDDLQLEALEFHIKYDSTRPDDKKYGFFGETVLNVLLQQYYNTDVLVARGQFYSPLSKSEAHGFDSHHFVVRDNKIELWLGEAKFYQSYSNAVEKIIENMNRNLSAEYLSTNFLEIVKKKYPLASTNAVAKVFMNDLQSQPLGSVSAFLSKYNAKIVYPALVICNDLKRECVIEKSIQAIEDKLKMVSFANEINASIFFIFLPVINTSAIKQEVLNWIKIKKPLI